MKVFFDARFVHPTRLDGFGRYSLELLTAYAKVNPDVTMIIYDKKQLTRLPKLPYVMLANPESPKMLFDARRLNKLGADVVFSPSQVFGSFGRKFKLILTLHDTIYYQFRTPPHWLSPIEKVGWRAFHLTSLPQRFVLNRADIVATVSETSADDIRARHLTDRPIKVVYNAANNLASKQTKPERAADAKKTLVYMGSFIGYKNVETLIRALKFLPGYELILCSKITDSRRRELLADVPDDAEIVFKNGIPDAEYAKLLASTTALVTASRAEGFNLSIIEAMRAGTPVITSDLPVHREVAGDAAQFFACDDAKTLASEVRTLADKNIRAKFISKGKKQAAKFSWQKSAKKLDKIVKSLASK